VDADLRILYQSPALRHLLGYEPADTVGRNVSELIQLVRRLLSSP